MLTDNFGRKLCSQVNTNRADNGEAINPTGQLNPNYGSLRVWENTASIYDSMQVSVRKQLSRGLQFGETTPTATPSMMVRHGKAVLQA